MINELIIKSNNKSIEFYREGDHYYVRSNGVDGAFDYNISIPSLGYEDDRVWNVIVDQKAFKSLTISELPINVYIGDVFDIEVYVNPSDLPKSDITITSSDNITVNLIDSNKYRVTANSLGDSSIVVSLPAYDNAITQKTFTVESIPVDPLTWVRGLSEAVEYNVGDLIELTVDVIGGEEPYSYVWKDDLDNVFQDSVTNTFSKIADVDMDGITLSVIVTDNGDRTITSQTTISIIQPEPESEPE